MRESWWAVRLGLWLWVLPLRLRVYSLPVLLQRLTPGEKPLQSRRPPELDGMVRLVVWLCQLRLLCWTSVPRACLRQALALYYVLTRLGYHVEVHFGVYKAGEELHGHSWVTIQGQPVAEHTPPEALTMIYSFPSTAERAPQEHTRQV